MIDEKELAEVLAKELGVDKEKIDKLFKKLQVQALFHPVEQPSNIINGSKTEQWQNMMKESHMTGLFTFASNGALRALAKHLPDPIPEGYSALIDTETCKYIKNWSKGSLPQKTIDAYNNSRS